MAVKKYIITATDVVDNLTSTDVDVPLSARQGKILNTSKISVFQGTENAGRVLAVGSEGNVVLKKEMSCKISGSTLIIEVS